MVAYDVLFLHILVVFWQQSIGRAVSQHLRGEVIWVAHLNFTNLAIFHINRLHLRIDESSVRRDSK